MPQPMFIPNQKQQNPFAQMIPQMFMQAMGMKMQRKMQLEDEERQQKYTEQAEKRQQDYIKNAVPKWTPLKEGGGFVSYLGKTQYIDEKTVKDSDFVKKFKMYKAGEMSTPQWLRSIGALPKEEKPGKNIFKGTPYTNKAGKRVVPIYDKNYKLIRKETLGDVRETGAKGEVTWTTATNNLSKRFGKQDAIGNIIITPELQTRHRLAQKKLVELKKEGNIGPLEAINTAEDYANTVETNYKSYLESAKTKEQKQKVRAQFKAKYGYIPR